MNLVEQFNAMKLGVVDFIGEDEVIDKVVRGRQLRVKLGVDPTRPDLHLGHMVVLRKLRQFQDMGDKVILIIGDFTATIGDPTGKNTTRPILTLEQAQKNAESYIEQCGLILNTDPDLLEIQYNSTWFGFMLFSQMLTLMETFTVHQIMNRQDFSNRFADGIPIGIHELMYPIMQGHDSVMVDSDIEIGGTDQLFNNLMGRQLNGQAVMTMPLLEGIKGGSKMSKSLDNFIALNEDTNTMFAKFMKIDDSILRSYFELLTNVPQKAIDNLLLTPVLAHEVLATIVIKSIRPDADIGAAADRFRGVAKNKIPDDIPVVHVDFNPSMDLIGLFVDSGLTKSRTETRRMVENKGLKVDGKVVTLDNLFLSCESVLMGIVLQRGKDKFVKVVLND